MDITLMDRDSSEEVNPEIKSTEKPPNFLLRFPIMFFGICLGTCSQSMLWKNLSMRKFPSVTGWMHTPMAFGWIWWVIGVFFLSLVSIIYITKAIIFPSVVRRELAHPGRSNLMFAPMLSLLFLTNGVPKSIENLVAVEVVFWIGFLWQVALTTYLYGKWIFSEVRNLQNIQATYLMSVVGWFVVTPLAVRLKHEMFGHFCFSVGIVFLGIVYVSLFINLANIKLKAKTSPILFLFIAPPSAACLAAASLTEGGEFGFGAKTLYYLAVFFGLLILRLLKIFFVGKFNIGFWAYTFPLTALSIASLTFSHAVDDMLTRMFAMCFSIFSGALVLVVFIRTCIQFFQKGLFNDPMLGKLQADARSQSIRRMASSTIKSASSEVKANETTKTEIVTETTSIVTEEVATTGTIN